MIVVVHAMSDEVEGLDVETCVERASLDCVAMIILDVDDSAPTTATGLLVVVKGFALVVFVSLRRIIIAANVSEHAGRVSKDHVPLRSKRL